MPYCSNCGHQVEATDKFCGGCGAPVSAPAAAPAPEAAPAPQVVVAPAPQPVPVAQPATPEISSKTKVFGFVGMGLGIGGLFFAVLGIIYTLVGMGETGLGFGMSVGFGLFSAPMSILGIKFSNDSARAGNSSKCCTVGSKLGLAGIIVSGVMLFLGFINLFV